MILWKRSRREGALTMILLHRRGILYMEHAVYNAEEVGRRGRELYEQNIRARVETEDNIGKIVMIDVDSGDYEIDPVGLQASKRLRVRHPDAVLLALRIGYDAVDAFGGAELRRVKA
jgi:hypothetical protein